MIKKLSVLAIFCLASIQASAQTTPSPGEYLTEGGWGTLTVAKEKDGSTKFDISAIGSNGHSCGLDGKIVKGVANVDPEPKDEPDLKCKVTFKSTPNGFNVIPDGNACSHYCGMRASFDGEYLKVAQECLPSSIGKARKAHLKLYKEKKYDESLSHLEPVFNNCSKTLFWHEKAQIQNDLAVTYAKLNKFDECSKVLHSLKEDAKMTENQVKENYPPLEAEIYWPVIKATKTNLRLCKVK